MRVVIALTVCMMFGVVGYGHEKTNETHLHDLSQTTVIAYGSRKTWANDLTNLPVHNCVKDITDEAIKELVKSGRVCKVIGHTWTSSLSLIYAPGWSFRHCRVCKKEESQSLTDWK